MVLVQLEHQVHVVRKVLLEPLIGGAAVGETLRGQGLHLVNLLKSKDRFHDVVDGTLGTTSTRWTDEKEIILSLQGKRSFSFPTASSDHPFSQCSRQPAHRGQSEAVALSTHDCGQRCAWPFQVHHRTDTHCSAPNRTHTDHIMRDRSIDHPVPRAFFFSCVYRPSHTLSSAWLKLDAILNFVCLLVFTKAIQFSLLGTS